jgi:crotonobetainyl-CoA:carnitine CoA-transferase CaiB-like acyl-CoA transferase
VDSNLLNGAVLLSSAWFSAYEGRPIRPLADREQYGLNLFHRLFRLANGWIYVAAQTEEQRQALCQVVDVNLGDEANNGHPNEGPLAQALAAAFAGRPLHDTLAALRQAGVPVAEAQKGDSELFLDDPHTAENDMVVTVQHPTAGKLLVAHRLIQFSNSRLSSLRPTPLLGEQTDETLREVGYSEAEIRALHDDKVVLAETA